MDSFVQLAKRFALDVESMTVYHDADIRLHIDSKVEELRHTIILFHQLRNRRTAIAKLPNELLGLIFYYIRDIGVSECGAARLSWIPSVSHVCSLWRQLALSMPHLWASISVTSVGRDWLPEMVRRSSSAPLTISAKYDGFSFMRNLQSVLGQDILHRLDTLELTNVDSSCLPDIFSSSSLSENGMGECLAFKFRRRFSSLRKLAISAKLGRLSDPFVLSDATLDAPHLQELELTKCAAQWDSKIFGRLTHLSITNPTGFDSSASFTLLHALAAASETLTSLSLVRALPSIYPSKKLYLDSKLSDVSIPALVHFPLLQKLYIDETVTNVDQTISFFGIISATTRTKIEISVNGADDQRTKQHPVWQNDFSRIMACIPEFLCRSGWTASSDGFFRNNTVLNGHYWPFITPMAMGGNVSATTDINALSLCYSTSWQRSRFEVGLGTGIPRTATGGDTYPLDVSLSFEWVRPREVICDTTTCDISAMLSLQVFDIFDLSRLRQLRCQGIDMPTDSWRRVFCSLEGLEEVEFDHVPAGQNNFFSGSLASGEGTRLMQSLERFLRALHWDDEDKEPPPNHIPFKYAMGYRLLRLAPVLRLLLLKEEPFAQLYTILQDTLCRRVGMGLSPFEVVVSE